MKIAIVTDDEQSISAHFGRARFFQVVTLEDGRVVSRERRAKPAHGGHGAGSSHAVSSHAGSSQAVTLNEGSHEHGHEHSHDHDHHDDHAHHSGPEADSRHAAMAAAVADCEALFAGGMGAGMRAAVLAQGVRLFLTNIRSIDAALEAYTQGRLVDLSDSRQCAHDATH
ncbi:MAG TPA: NifB/NifX family molybdenum-iron cluster-binding protein [Anaerolineales bacterium]|nr:NifB/NifX family molybdenum-iron cluster-binding protein [Anaerolineales bacterium]